ncbi:hypothetical protein [Streptomyces sp. 8N616]|uniref:hypothetical protein n=1 Tax=Streptomyces sp. 8N616 TaxID=3457414 RepID=UPI003FCF7938
MRHVPAQHTLLQRLGTQHVVRHQQEVPPGREPFVPAQHRVELGQGAGRPVAP